MRAGIQIGKINRKTCKLYRVEMEKLTTIAKNHAPKIQMLLIFKSNVIARRIFITHIFDNDEIENAVLNGRNIEIATTTNDFIELEAYLETLINDAVCYDIEYQDFKNQTNKELCRQSY